MNVRARFHGHPSKSCCTASLQTESVNSRVRGKKIMQDSSFGGPWMPVQISMSIHPVFVELFQSGSKLLDQESSISIQHGTKWRWWHCFSRFLESAVWFPYRLSYKWTKTNDRMEIIVKKYIQSSTTRQQVNALCCPRCLVNNKALQISPGFISSVIAVKKEDSYLWSVSLFVCVRLSLSIIRITQSFLPSPSFSHAGVALHTFHLYFSS